MASGRPSVAAKVAVQHQAEEPPPSPPEDMEGDQLEVWERVTNALPGDWFRPETLDLLEAYCIHVARRRDISKRANDMTRRDRQAGNCPSAETLSIYREELAQTKEMVELATKMRITQQSTYDASKRKPKPVNSLWKRAG